MTITIRRWNIDRKKDKYISPEEKTVSGKNAKEIMRLFNDVKLNADLFSHTQWEIVNIQD